MKTINLPPTRKPALRKPAFRPAAAALAIALGAGLVPGMTSAAVAASTECVAQQPGGPTWVTADCLDSTYNRPIIDAQADVSVPVAHRKVSGHFEGTNIKFNIYLPDKTQWQGRFFQFAYPTQDENALDDTISFGAASGAYTVQTTGTGGYRHDAAAAKFARKVAAEYYGSTAKIYGYIYGGSGGSFQTVGAIENTTGVWDGAVPIIQGVPTSIPNNFFVRAYARLVLESKAAQIADAVSPGGNGDPYAGLNDTERAVLTEVTKMGVPLKAWEDYTYVLGLSAPDGLLGFGAVIRGVDPSYADNFWSQPGYLGTEQSALGDIFRAAKIDQKVTIVNVNRDANAVPSSLVLDNVPANPRTTGLDFTAYSPDGTTKLGKLSGTLDPANKVFTLAAGNPEATLAALDAGYQVRVDNTWDLALRAYHRHQVPTRAGFTAWDQFRLADGTPIFPQRFEFGPIISASVSGGGTHTGKINGKVIVVDNLVDSDAFPWHADWYAQRVKEALGDRFDDNYRLWYNDNADHQFGPVTGPKAARLVEFTDIYQQALRDVSAWVEKGITPPKSTEYSVDQSQVEVPANASVRRGIQPVVDLSARGETRIDVQAGQPVKLNGKIQVPYGAGKVIAAEWDFAGDGHFTPTAIGEPRQSAVLEETFTYTKPGTYFPVLRATSQRQGDTNAAFGLIQNLGRMRIVVH